MTFWRWADWWWLRRCEFVDGLEELGETGGVLDELIVGREVGGAVSLSDDGPVFVCGAEGASLGEFQLLVQNVLGPESAAALDWSGSASVVYC